MAEIGVGMLGYAFMGKAHSHALLSIGHMTWPRAARAAARRHRRPLARRPSPRPRSATASSRGRPTGARWSPTTGSALFDNCGPNALHAEPTIAAAEAGKHVICEKPLGMNADESYEIWQRVQATGVKHACGFNYRFVPAVRLARQMLEAGELGEIRHFRGRYLQDWLSDPAAPKTWRLDSAEAGTGAIGDLGTHVIDLARYLVGEIESISALTRTFVDERGGAEGRRRRRLRVGRGLPRRCGRHDRGDALRARAQERVPVGDQRLEGLARVRHGAPQRAAGLARRGRASSAFS